MNITELTSSLYGTNVRNINASGYASKVLNKTDKATNASDSFENILSSYALSGDADDLMDGINEVKQSLDSLDEENTDNDAVNKSNVMNILTDAHVAKEYLESKSGRNLIVSMVENQIASIIAGNDQNE